MENKLHIAVSPHIRSSVTTRSVMRDVLIALAPAVVAGSVIFGLRSLLVLAVCVAVCVGTEFVWNLIIKKEQTVGDLSAAVTGVILGLNLFAKTPLWQAAVGSLFAILVVKCFFGGIGCNIVNPAVTARVFMLVAFSSMTKAAAPVSDTASGATPLVELANGNTVAFKDLLLGTTGGTIGETCAVALLIGFIYLLVRKVISWHIPVTMCLTVFVLSFLLGGFDATFAASQVLSGGLLLGAVFMATDYVTSPSSSWGKVVFAAGAGIITVIIRFYGNYPEGVSFSILLMNILEPYISSLTAKKVFGGAR